MMNTLCIFPESLLVKQEGSGGSCTSKACHRKAGQRSPPSITEDSEWKSMKFY